MMIGDQVLVIHFVDMITGKDQYLFRVMVLHEIKIPVYCICRPAIPVFLLGADIGRQHGNTPITPEHIPGSTGADMIDKGITAILTEDGDLLNA